MNSSYFEKRQVHLYQKIFNLEMNKRERERERERGRERKTETQRDTERDRETERKKDGGIKPTTYLFIPAN